MSFRFGGLLRLLRETTTVADNKTFDIVRITGALMALQFLVLSGWSVIVLKQPFDPNSYGLGSGAMVAALGVAMRLRPDPTGAA